MTFSGLIILLKLPQLWEHEETVDNIAEQYAEYLPLLFGKWALYAKHGFKKTITNRLKQVIEDPSIPNPLTSRSPDEEAQISITCSRTPTGQYPIKTNENASDTHLQPPATMIDPRNITELVLASSFTDPARFYKLLMIAAKDRDLRQFFNQYMKKIEKIYFVGLQTIREWRKTWSQLKT